MSSVTAFNDMMDQFLAELHKTFPEEKGIKNLKSYNLKKFETQCNMRFKV